MQTHIRRNPSCRAGLICYNTSNQSTESSYVPLAGPQYNAGETPPSLSFLGDFLSGYSTRTKILQSCNGLLLCMFLPDNARMLEKYLVCNQTTKKYRILPPSIDHSALLYSVCTLAFDPSISPHYKVISLSVSSVEMIRHEELCEIQIYSSEDHSWRVSGSFVPYSENGVFMNGAVYWDKYCINVCTEEVKRISDFDPSYTIRPFEECCKNWSAMKNTEEDDRRRSLIHEMRRELGKWVVKHRVSVGSFRLNLLGAEKGFKFIPLCIFEGVRDSELVFEIPGKLLSYSMTDDKVKTLCDLPVAMTYGNNAVYLFVESLASV